MIKNGKRICDWCGRGIRASTPHFSYADGSDYHVGCSKKVGGSTDLGGFYNDIH